MGGPLPPLRSTCRSRPMAGRQPPTLQMRVRFPSAAPHRPAAGDDLPFLAKVNISNFNHFYLSFHWGAAGTPWGAICSGSSDGRAAAAAAGRRFESGPGRNGGELRCHVFPSGCRISHPAAFGNRQNKGHALGACRSLKGECDLTVPKVGPDCGAYLDPGEVCDCGQGGMCTGCGKDAEGSCTCSGNCNACETYE